MIRSDDDGRTLEEVIEDSKFMNIAFHEAGHGVVGHRLGYHLESIRVWPDGEDYFGEALFSSLPEDGEDSAIVMAAGAASHAMRQKKLAKHNERAKFQDGKIIRFKPFSPDLSPDDGRVIRRYLDKNYFSGPGRDREYRRVTTRAAQLVEEHWADIVAVVEVLEKGWDEEGEVSINRKTFLRAIGEES